MILHIALLILKIIGIVLAVLIGLVIILLCLALFVPVRYQVKAARNEGEGEPPVRLKARVSWLFPLFQVRFLYPSDVYLRVKLLFFTVFRMPFKEKADKKLSGKQKSPEKKKFKKKKEDKKRRDKKQNAAKPEGRDEKSEQEQVAKLGAEEIDTEAKTTLQKESATETAETGSETNIHLEPVKKSGIWVRLKSVYGKIIQFFQKIRYTIESLCDKIKKIRENIIYYIELLQSETFIQAFGLCKEELVSILTYIRPRKLEADFVVGMGDPAATGQVLSVYGILIPLIGNHVRVTGDFEQKRIEGTLFIKGRMTLFRFVKTACRIYFNKDIRKLIRILKKEDA